MMVLGMLLSQAASGAAEVAAQEGRWALIVKALAVAVAWVLAGWAKSREKFSAAKLSATLAIAVVVAVAAVLSGVEPEKVPEWLEWLGLGGAVAFADTLPKVLVRLLPRLFDLWRGMRTN